MIRIKLRLDFVTNSSSSSFAILKLTDEKLISILQENGFEGLELSLDYEEDSEIKAEFLRHILEITGEEYHGSEDYAYLSEAYISFIKKMTGIEVRQEAVRVTVCDEYWGEGLDSLIDEAGILCHYLSYHHQWRNENGEHYNKWHYKFYEKPEADVESLQMIIDNEKTVDELINPLIGVVDDISPVIAAFWKGFRKMKGLSEEEIARLMGNYYDMIEIDNSNGIPFKSDPALEKIIPIKDFTTDRSYSLILNGHGEVFSLHGQVNGLVDMKDSSKIKVQKFGDLPEIRSMANCYYLFTATGKLLFYSSDSERWETFEAIDNVIDVSSWGHVLLLTTAGTVYSFGYCLAGALGQGEITYSELPRLVEGLPPAVAVGAGEEFSVVLSAAGDLYSFGLNHAGLLGLKDKNSRYHPARIDLPPILSFDVGSGHTLALSFSGEVYSFGDGLRGQLGHNDGEDWYAPAKVVGIPPIKAVAAGDYHSLFLTADGMVYACGDNQYGQLGITDAEAILRPVLVGNLPKIVSIKAGGSCSLMLSAEGKLFSYGDNKVTYRTVIRT